MAKIGIDFGTSYSTMSWVNPRTNRAEPIRINGKEKIPTMLYFSADDDEPLVGGEAYAMYEQCRQTTDQDEIEAYMSGIISGLKRNMNKEETVYLPSGKGMTYIELIAQFLKYMKTEAETNCFEGEEVTDVCLTYPVKHEAFKKDIMREAARKAGFKNVKLLMEPVAAAMGYQNAFEYKNHSILVYDFGGGTFDLAFVKFDAKGDYITLEPLGDPNCGGENIDALVYSEWDKLVKSATGKNIRPSDDICNQDEAFLRTDCMRQKETVCKCFPRLSRYVMRSYIGGEHRGMTMTKDHWNELISPVIDKTIALTQQMLNAIKAENMKIDKTILIGGSSRIPQVTEKLTRILPSPPLHVNDLDVAVANGAAVFINQGEIPIRKCFCRKCGHELTTKMKFCPYCGTNNIRYDYRFNDMK